MATARALSARSTCHQRAATRERNETTNDPSHVPPAEASQPGFTRYVAIGDSSTEGLEDPRSDGTGYRGWADRLAELLDEARPGLLYANLAIRGRKLGQIRAEQLEPALAMQPDVMTIGGGLNDILRRSVDLELIADHLSEMVTAVRATGATVLIATYFDLSRTMPFVPAAVAGRVSAFNGSVREIAARHGAVLLDLEHTPLADRRILAADRLHMNAAGHAAVAAAAAEALGLPHSANEAAQTLPPIPGTSRSALVIREAAWAARHLTPWIVRRLRGVSSGDGRTAKRPELSPLS